MARRPGRRNFNPCPPRRQERDKPGSSILPRAQQAAATPPAAAAMAKAGGARQPAARDRPPLPYPRLAGI